MLMRSLAPRARPALQVVLRGVRAARPIHVSAMSQSKDAMPKEAEQLIKDEGFKYLDVRTVEEYSAGHAPAAVNVPVVFLGGGGMSPNPAFLSEVQRMFPNRAESLVVGCKSGRRSLMAIDILSQAGYGDLVNVTGGFDLWVAQGCPTEK